MANSRDELQSQIYAALEEIERIKKEVRDFKNFLKEYAGKIDQIPDREDEKQAITMLDHLRQNQKTTDLMASWLERCEMELKNDENQEDILMSNLDYVKEISGKIKEMSLSSSMEELSKSVTPSTPVLSDEIKPSGQDNRTDYKVYRAQRAKQRKPVVRIYQTQPTQSSDQELLSIPKQQEALSKASGIKKELPKPPVRTSNRPIVKETESPGISERTIRDMLQTANSRDELQTQIDAALREIEKIQGEVRDFKIFIENYKVKINDIPDENDKNQAKEILDRLLENEKKANGMLNALKIYQAGLLDDKNPEPVIKNHLDWAKKMSDLNKQLALISGLDELSKKVTASIPYVSPRSARKPFMPRKNRTQPAQSFNAELANKMIRDKSFPELPSIPKARDELPKTVETKKELPKVPERTTSQPIVKEERERESSLSFQAELFCLEKAVSANADPEEFIQKFLELKRSMAKDNPDRIGIFSACNELEDVVNTSSLIINKEGVIREIELIKESVKKGILPLNTDSLETRLLIYTKDISRQYNLNISSLTNIQGHLNFFDNHSKIKQSNHKIIDRFKSRTQTAKSELAKSGDPSKVLSILKGNNGASKKVGMMDSFTMFSEKNARKNANEFTSMIKDVEEITNNFEKRNNLVQRSGHRNR